MAAKMLEAKVKELLIASPVLKGLLAKDSNGNLEVHLGQFSPVNAHFPQVTFTWDEADSEEVLPALHGTLYFNVYVARIAKEPYSLMTRIVDEIENIINKRPQIMNEINEAANEGLRVVRSVKQSGQKTYSDDPEFFWAPLSFDIVKSDKFAQYNIHYGNESVWP